MEKNNDIEFMGKVEGDPTYYFIFAFQKIGLFQGGIVFYRWIFFARKKSGLSIICIPDLVMMKGDGIVDERPTKFVRK